MFVELKLYFLARNDWALSMLAKRNDDNAALKRFWTEGDIAEVS